jgi:hypothetical protein
MPDSIKAKPGSLRTLVRNLRLQQERERDHWIRGYFCCVAKLIESEGGLTTTARELFAAGGNPQDADEQDKEVFRRHGLMPPDTPP